MNKQTEAIYNDLSTAGWNIFTSAQSKIDTAEHLAALGYRKVSDILHELDEEICSAIQKREYDVTAFSFAEIVDMVFNKVLEKYESEKP